jgi:hypothetical protein
MGKWSVGSSWGVVVVALGLVGCSGTSTKDRCKTICEFDNRCAGESVSCSDSSINECVDSYKKLPGDCQDAFDDFADCLDDNDKCDDAKKECIDEAEKVLDKCFDT